MKLYRAIFWHNNADYCEWERWFYKASVWYNSKELAEKHLEELHKYKQYLLEDVYKKAYADGIFKYEEPFIDEMDINTELVPFELEHNDEHIWYNFNGKHYI